MDQRQKSRSPTVLGSRSRRDPICGPNRVDIGVFAKAKGTLTSAPAFISFTTLANEHRTYTEDGKLLEIFYGARSRDLGIPPADSPRWDDLLSRFDTPTKALTLVFDKEHSKLLSDLASVTKDLRAQLTTANGQLNAITGAQQKIVDETNKVRLEAIAAHKKEPSEIKQSALNVANANYNAAKKSMHDGEDGAAALKEEIATLLAKVAIAIREKRAPEAVRVALTDTRNNPHFFSQNGAAIRSLAKGSAFAAVLKRFQSTCVKPSDNLPPNDLYHLSQFHTDILSEVFFPSFLKRPPGFNYVDPRLTSTKRWRDVYHYDKAGKLTGWTRYQHGEATEFTPKAAAKLRYTMNPKTKLLEVSP